MIWARFENDLRIFNQHSLLAAVQQGEVQLDTLVANMLAPTLGDVRSAGWIPLNESWIAKNSERNTKQMKDKRILILFLTIFIDLLGFGIVIPILPNLAKTLAATSGMPFNPDVAVGGCCRIFSIIQFLFAPIFGAWSDRIDAGPSY